MLKEFIQSFLNFFDMQIVRYSNTDEFRITSLLENHNIDTIIDCGANNGLYGKNLRKQGFKGEIISFEPIKKIFESLKGKSQKDKYWSAYNYALGDTNKRSTINISGNLSSSSLLEILPQHIESEPKSKVIAKEEIEIKSLSSIFDELNLNNKSIYFKIDVQGFEDKVLDGAEDIISKIKGIQIEMSLVPLYGKSILMPEMINRMKRYGFELMGVLPVFWDKSTQQMLQVDGVFFKIK
mgnify:CR=1 FL=1|jgi:FkbM family methyltransferase